MPVRELDTDSLDLEALIQAATAEHGSIVLDPDNITFGDSVFLELALTTDDSTDL